MTGLLAVQRTLDKKPVQATFTDAEKIKPTKSRGFTQEKKTGLAKYQEG